MSCVGPGPQPAGIHESEDMLYLTPVGPGPPASKQAREKTHQKGGGGGEGGRGRAIEMGEMVEGDAGREEGADGS